MIEHLPFIFTRLDTSPKPFEETFSFVVMMSADEAQIDEIVKDKPYSDMIKQLSMKQLDENTEEISEDATIEENQDSTEK